MRGACPGNYGAFICYDRLSFDLVFSKKLLLGSAHINDNCNPIMESLIGNFEGNLQGPGDFTAYQIMALVSIGYV